MKNLLNRLDELEDGSFGRKLTKAQKWAMDRRRYRDGAYRRIRPIRPAALVGRHVDDVIRKYTKYLPDDWRSPNRLLNYLGIEIIARDGCFVDAGGARYTWRRHVYAGQYYVNEVGIIVRNTSYRPYRYSSRNRAEPHHIRIRKHAEAASKERKAERDRRKAEAIKKEDLIDWLFAERRRKARALEIQKLIQHGFDPKLSFRNHEIREN